jgi:peptidoglycan/LPS O-acetylase OafA/YrhL
MHTDSTLTHIDVVNQKRRYDLDWFRIALFLGLIFYHIGMFYVPWGWHVKSHYAPVHDLLLPMLLLNPWRIPALFIISGIALRFALDKSMQHGSTEHGTFMWRRFVRLILPILFGMAVICAPQAYYELQQDGVSTGTMTEFYSGYLLPPWLSPAHWTTITPTWNHLWYVVYVLVLTIVIVAISAALKGRLQQWLDHIISYCCNTPILLLSIPMLVSLFLLWLLQNSIDAVQMVWGDWHRLANSLWLMLFGFAIAKHTATWSVLWRYRWWLLALALILGAVQVMDIRQLIWTDSSDDALYYITCSFYSWAMMLTLLAFVPLLRRGPDRVRQYLSDAVFPYYVLHQTIIVVCGVCLSQYQLGFARESVLLIIATLVLTAAIYHLVVRRMGRLALLVGGKPG